MLHSKLTSRHPLYPPINRRDTASIGARLLASVSAHQSPTHRLAHSATGEMPCYYSSRVSRISLSLFLGRAMSKDIEPACAMLRRTEGVNTSLRCGVTAPIGAILVGLCSVENTGNGLI